jgi:hypothetical protein
VSDGLEEDVSSHGVVEWVLDVELDLYEELEIFAGVVALVVQGVELGVDCFEVVDDGGGG